MLETPETGAANALFAQDSPNYSKNLKRQV